MRGYVDHVSEDAVGCVSKEWKQMASLALQLRRTGCNPVWAEEQEKKFVGIYRRLLEESDEFLEKESRR